MTLVYLSELCVWATKGHRSLERLETGQTGQGGPPKVATSQDDGSQTAKDEKQAKFQKKADQDGLVISEMHKPKLPQGDERGQKRAGEPPDQTISHANKRHIRSASLPLPPLKFTTSANEKTLLLLQPETRPITQEQLVNEVKGIYAGLVMVEKKCVEIDQQQASATNKLSGEQWQALIALHRTLLHEHHDFFLATQHPSSSPALQRLATKYAMPARMWRHGIHSFLELLRRQLPDSLDQMLAFIYLSYSMMALLLESVPSFEETWIECLGDLARYRMAIEEADLRDREVWCGVARMWYNKAADKSPNVGRIQHHLAVLARPNIVRQLYYYSKALVSVIPFQNARESIMLLFNPFLEGSEIASQRYPLVESALVKAHGILFTHGSILEYTSLINQFASVLNNHIDRVAANFRIQGPEIASSLCAATFDFGNPKSFLCQVFQDENDRRKRYLEAYNDSHDQKDPPEDPQTKFASMKSYWVFVEEKSDHVWAIPHRAHDVIGPDIMFSHYHDASAFACQSLYKTTAVISQRIGDKNVVPYMHVILAYLLGLAFVPKALIYVENHIPWEDITVFLNTLNRYDLEDCFEGENFPKRMGGTGRQLPEDFVIRGLDWAKEYFPVGFFSGQMVGEDERNELPSHTAARAARCLWIGVQLASVNRWIRYDTQTKQFSPTEYAKALARMNKSSGILQHLSPYLIALVMRDELPDLPKERARTTIERFFKWFVGRYEIARHLYPLVESTLAKAMGLLFSRGSVWDYRLVMQEFHSLLDRHIDSVGATFRAQGVAIAYSLCAATLGFGDETAFLSGAFREEADRRLAQKEVYQPKHDNDPPPQSLKEKCREMQAYWAIFRDSLGVVRAEPDSVGDLEGATFSSPRDAAAHACQWLGDTTALVSEHTGDRNVLPYMYTILAYLLGLALVPKALAYVERCIHWEKIPVFLNSLDRSGVVEACFERVGFPRQLPDDFTMRNLVWAHYFPVDFIEGQPIEDKSVGLGEVERCLWLGVRLASCNQWIRYDDQTKLFSPTPLAEQLAQMRKARGRLSPDGWVVIDGSG